MSSMIWGGLPHPKSHWNTKIISNFVLFTFLVIFWKFFLLRNLSVILGGGDPLISYYLNVNSPISRSNANFKFPYRKHSKTYCTLFKKIKNDSHFIKQLPRTLSCEPNWGDKTEGTRMRTKSSLTYACVVVRFKEKTKLFPIELPKFF